MDRSEIETVLEACEIFRGLEQSDIKEIATLCKVETYEPGRHVFRQGEYGLKIYVIAEGQVSLERAVDLGARKGSVVIGMLGKGRVFGCWSTLLGEPHNLMSSACSQKPTRVIAMMGADVRAIMIRNKSFGFSVLERLCLLLRDRIQGVYGAMERVC
jgi:CRP/FNR family cyclic AMP-dependent transcriptional regulator